VPPSRGWRHRVIVSGGPAARGHRARQQLQPCRSAPIDAAADAFGSTVGEARILLAARQGEALLVAGTNRVVFRVVASAAEGALCQDSLELERMLNDSATNSGMGLWRLSHVEPSVGELRPPPAQHLVDACVSVAPRWSTGHVFAGVTGLHPEFRRGWR
jgi:hypothetical protein